MTDAAFPRDLRPDPSEAPAGGGARPPRVLMVASFPPPFTGQTVATQAFARWVRQVAEVDELNLADPNRHQRPSGAFSWDQLARVWRVRRRIREGGPWDIGYLTLASSTLGDHVHQGSFGLATRGWMRAPLRRTLVERVDRFLFIARTLAEWTPWIPPERLRIVPNPPGEGARFTSVEVDGLQEARAGEKDYRVLFLANPLPDKGHQRLLAALPRVREALTERRRLRVDVVGAWPSPAKRAAYEERAAALGLEEVVRVHGAVRERTRVRELLARAHVLAFPSTYREEGAPLAVIEAMGAGTPVVASSHGALPEMVEDGRSGLVLERPDPEALARALVRLADAGRWRDFSTAARARYEERYAPEAVRATFLDALLDDDEP